MTHITKGAATGAFVTHDHEGGRSFAKTLPNIGTGSLFADCVQFVLSQD
jgi:hypothetical protein